MNGEPYQYFNLAQVPDSIPRPDYAFDGVPRSEIESRQQRTGTTLRPFVCRPSQLLAFSVQNESPVAHALGQCKLWVLCCCACQSLHVSSLQPSGLLLCAAVPIRNAKEIAGMRVACRLAREILDKAHAAVKPGVTTDEVDRVVSQLITTASATTHYFSKLL